MKKVITFFVPLQFAALALCGQSLSPSVVATQGAYNETASFSLEWTLGESFVETTPIRDLILTEGLHQPMLPFRELQSVHSPFYNDSDLTGDLKVQFGIEVYPNPFQSEITIEIDGEYDQDYKVTLLDVNGMLIRKSRIPSGTGTVTIDGLDLPPSMYLIKVEGTSGAGTQVREVIKFN